MMMMVLVRMLLLGREDLLVPRLILIVSITVAVAIAIAVATVAVTGVTYERAVQDEGHVLELVALVQLLNLWEHAAVEFAYTDNEDGQVGHTVGDGGIGHDTYRYVIDEDVVVTGTQVLDELFQTVAQQQLGWVWSDRSCGNQIQIVGHAVWLDDVLNLGVAGQIGGHTDLSLLGAATLGQGSLTDIQIDHDDLLLGLGERGGQVGGYEGLTGTRCEGTEGDDLQVLRLHLHEVHVGADGVWHRPDTWPDIDDYLALDSTE